MRPLKSWWDCKSQVLLSEIGTPVEETPKSHFYHGKTLQASTVQFSERNRPSTDTKPHSAVVLNFPDSGTRKEWIFGVVWYRRMHSRKWKDRSTGLKMAIYEPRMQDPGIHSSLQSPSGVRSDFSLQNQDNTPHWLNHQSTEYVVCTCTYGLTKPPVYGVCGVYMYLWAGIRAPSCTLWLEEEEYVQLYPSPIFLLVIRTLTEPTRSLASELHWSSSQLCLQHTHAGSPRTCAATHLSIMNTGDLMSWPPANTKSTIIHWAKFSAPC